MQKGRIIGIGGIFFRSDDPAKTKDWYGKNMGLKTDQYGAPFASRKFSNAESKAYLQWSPFESKTEYFGDGDQQFMVNYRVEHIEALVDQLRKEGVTICDEIASYEYGKFVHIEDIDGRRVELWEPVDEVFDQMTKEEDLNLE